MGVETLPSLLLLSAHSPRPQRDFSRHHTRKVVWPLAGKPLLWSSMVLGKLGHVSPAVVCCQMLQGLEVERYKFLSEFAQGSNFWKSPSLCGPPEQAFPEGVFQSKSWSLPLTNIYGVPFLCQNRCLDHSHAQPPSLAYANHQNWRSLALIQKESTVFCFLF